MEEERKVILTKPYFSSEPDSLYNYKPPNLIRRILSLFQNVRIGSDFTSMQLPAHFNVPKSHLQIYGEPIYSIVNSEMLRKCNMGKSSIERLIAVIAWYISILQPLVFGTAPFNPILGETHHVSKGSLNVLLEQISHHPPVTALHATDEEENIELLCSLNAVAKFYGTSFEVEVHGKRQLNLHNHGETYVLNSPKLLVKFFPSPRIEWTGTLRVRCPESGLEAELIPNQTSLLTFGANPKSVKGKIFESTSLKPLFNLDGLWDKFIILKDLSTHKTRVIYNSKEVTSGLKAPIVKNPKGIWATESALVWSEVSKSILNKDWAKATEIKKSIEEKQRKLLRERNSRGETWKPKHFVITYNKEIGWDCSPVEKFVSPASIVMP